MGKEQLSKQFKRLHREIRQLILAWNPFNVPDPPEDEYSELEFLLLGKLFHGIKVEELEAYANTWLKVAGLYPTAQDLARNRHHAELIMAWWHEQQESNDL